MANNVQALYLETCDEVGRFEESFNFVEVLVIWLLIIEVKMPVLRGIEQELMVSDVLVICGFENS